MFIVYLKEFDAAATLGFCVLPHRVIISYYSGQVLNTYTFPDNIDQNTLSRFKRFGLPVAESGSPHAAIKKIVTQGE